MLLSDISSFDRIRPSLIALASLLCIGLASQAHAQSAFALDGATALNALQTTRLSAAEFFAEGMTRRFTASRYELDGQGTRSSAGPPFEYAAGRGNAGAGVWFDAYGSYSKMATERNADDLQNWFAGGTLGFDVRGDSKALSPLRIGAALGYVYTHAKSDPGVTEDHSSSFQGAVYASYTLSRLYVGVMGRLAYANIETERDITNAGATQTAVGDTSGLDTSAYVEVGGLIGDAEKLAFRPLASFHYTWIQQDAFQEAGAGADSLSIAEKTTTSLDTSLGARLSSLWRYDAGLFGGGPIGEFGLEPELHFSWNHEFGDRGRHVNATDSSGTYTRLEGAESGRDYFLVGTGYTMRFHPTALLYLTYDARIQTDRVDQLARAGFLLHW